MTTQKLYPITVQAHCFVCTRCLYNPDGTAILVHISKREGICFGCQKETSAVIGSDTPIGQTRADLVKAPVYIEETFSGLNPLPWCIFDGAGNILAQTATRQMADALKPVLEANPSWSLP